MYCEGYLLTFLLASLLLVLQVRVFPLFLQISTFFSVIQSCRVGPLCVCVCLRFEDFKLVKMHVMNWVLTLCSVVDWYRHFARTRCLLHAHLESGSLEFP
jgi:hypothetical protein